MVSGIPPRSPGLPGQVPQTFVSASKTVHPGGAVGLQQQMVSRGPGGSSTSTSSNVITSPGGSASMNAVQAARPGVPAPGNQTIVNKLPLMKLPRVVY